MRVSIESQEILINYNINKMKIAVTSSDGENIDTHFGKAETVYVFEFQKSNLKLLEKRDIEKYCSEVPGHTFRNEEFQKVFDAISDCNVLYTKKIGKTPAEKCRSQGIEIKELDGKISTISD